MTLRRLAASVRGALMAALLAGFVGGAAAGAGGTVAGRFGLRGRRRGFRTFWYEILLKRTGHRLRGCGLRQGRRSWCAYGGAIPGRSGLHTIAPLSRPPARPLGRAGLLRRPSSGQRRIVLGERFGADIRNGARKNQ